jgi:hypothetical protein
MRSGTERPCEIQLEINALKRRLRRMDEKQHYLSTRLKNIFRGCASEGKEVGPDIFRVLKNARLEGWPLLSMI